LVDVVAAILVAGLFAARHHCGAVNTMVPSGSC
jgi:hypothetical protein